MGRIVLALCLVLGGIMATGCKSSTSDDDEGGPSGGDTKSDDACTITTTLTGGVTASLGDVSQACLYTSHTVSFVPLGGDVGIILDVSNIEPKQTGSFAATFEINVDKKRWMSAACTVEVEKNVQVAFASDGGEMFDRYALKGHGSCSEPAAPKGTDADGRVPVTIAPFTFTAQMLFY